MILNSKLWDATWKRIDDQFHPRIANRRYRLRNQVWYRVGDLIKTPDQDLIHERVYEEIHTDQPVPIHDSIWNQVWFETHKRIRNHFPKQVWVRNTLRTYDTVGDRVDLEVRDQVDNLMWETINQS